MSVVDLDVSSRATAERTAPASLVASVDCYAGFDAIAPDWLRLQTTGHATPYQTLGWARAWCEALARPFGVDPLLIAARDRRGQTLFILPLVVKRRGGVAMASFIGGKHANLNMALFDAGAMAQLKREDIATVLRDSASRLHLDLYRFANQPLAWNGRQNPLALLKRQPSPSSAWKATLAGDGDATLRGLMSSESLKKLRKKERKLSEVGPVAYVEARDEAEITAILDAFFAQKAARFAGLGLPDPFADDAVRAFIRAASRIGHDGRAPIRLFAIMAGERVASLFGGAIHDGRFSGMFTSFDADAAIARCSPGDLLLLHLVRTSSDGGLACFDLGVGEAAYKKDYCPIEEPLFDSLLPMTLSGRVAALAMSAAVSAKGAAKSSPAVSGLMQRLRRLRAD